jgi:4-amino-4-deoxy-L-arabinose transferase-like glycosyltransferase
MLGRLRTLAVLAVLAVAAAGAGLYTLQPLDRDEARFAQASVQMMESGDYIRISFQDEPRNKKPAGIYWLQTISVHAFSSPEARQIWAYRLPSVLGLLIAVLATYGAGCVLVGRKAAFAGAALLAVSVLAGIEGGIAKTDAMLLGMTALALAALAALYEGRSRWYGVLFWFAIAGGVLIKGPVTPMVAALALLLLYAFDRRIRWLGPLIFWPGPLLAVLMVGPWIYFMQKATGGAFLIDAFSQDLGPKLVSGQESHGSPPGYHMLLVWFLFFPGVVFLAPGIMMAVRACFRPYADAEAAGLRFLACWALPSWIVFELLPTKLPHYVLPLYPALALMAGAAYNALADRRIPIVAQLLSTLVFALAGGLYALVLILLPYLLNSGVALDPEFNRVMELLESVPPVEKLAPLVIAGGLLLIPIMFWRAPRTILVVALVAGLAWHWSARCFIAPSLETLDVSRRISSTLEALSLHPRLSPLTPGPLVSAGYSEPSLVFLTRTDTVLAADGAEAARLAAEESGRATLVEAAEREAFETQLEALGATAVVVAEINGLNYSRGDPVSITIYRTTQRARRPQREPGAAGGAGLGER